MRVINLVGWAGHNFSFAPGEIIELPPEVARGRIAAGLAAAADPAPPPAGPPIGDREAEATSTGISSKSRPRQRLQR